MELLIELLIAIVLFLCLGLSFYLGYRLGSKVKAPIQKATEEELLKAKRMREGFTNIMNYDVNKAMERRLGSG